jgi:O-Antigen ligase
VAAPSCWHADATGKTTLRRTEAGAPHDGLMTTSSTTATADARVTPLISKRPMGRQPRTPTVDPLAAAAVLLAAVLALSPLASGYYAFTSWAPLTLGSIVLLIVISLVARPRLTKTGLAASAGLILLLALSFASILWAESRDSAWTSANQLGLYVAIFAIGMLAVRERRSARTVMLILGAPALLTSVVLAIVLATGSGGGAYLLGRLDQPIGYVNGTAGMLAMGIWPWIALAEVARARGLRIAAMGGAGVIAALAVTTQARALVPALLVTTAIVMIAAPGRPRRGLHLLFVIAAIAASAHWTLAIYSSTGRAQAYMPPSAALRNAGLVVIAGGLLASALTFALEWLAARVPQARRARISRRVGQAMAAGVAVAVVAVGVGAHSTITTQWRDFTHLNAEQAAPNRFVAIGSGFRYDLWRIALDEFKADPLGGVGAGNYDDSYYRLRHNPQSVTVPHSLELQMLAELGIGGIIGLLLFCGAVLRAGLCRDRRTLAGRDPGLRIAALGMFTAWLTVTSFDWLYNIPGLAGMAILAAAILLVRAPGDEQIVPAAEGSESTRLARTRASPAVASLVSTSGRSLREQVWLLSTLCVLALIAASLGRQYVATLYSDSGKALVSKHPVQALQTLRTAELLDPWSLQTQYAVASAYARLNDYAAVRVALRHAEQLEPDNYVAPALLGDIATRAGDPLVALAAYDRALRLDPLEPVLQQAVKTAQAATQ